MKRVLLGHSIGAACVAAGVVEDPQVKHSAYFTLGADQIKSRPDMKSQRQGVDAIVLCAPAIAAFPIKKPPSTSGKPGAFSTVANTAHVTFDEAPSSECPGGGGPKRCHPVPLFATRF